MKCAFTKQTVHRSFEADRSSHCYPKICHQIILCRFLSLSTDMSLVETMIRMFTQEINIVCHVVNHVLPALCSVHDIQTGVLKPGKVSCRVEEIILCSLSGLCGWNSYGLTVGDNFVNYGLKKYAIIALNWNKAVFFFDIKYKCKCKKKLIIGFPKICKNGLTEVQFQFYHVYRCIQMPFCGSHNHWSRPMKLSIAYSSSWEMCKICC